LLDKLDLKVAFTFPFLFSICNLSNVCFTPLDICFALGLRIVGEKVDLVEDPESCTKKMFDGIEISKESIRAKLDNLQRDEDVEDFYRLYILLGLEEFYCPNSSPNVQDRVNSI
jgi:hypothetical protein